MRSMVFLLLLALAVNIPQINQVAEHTFKGHATLLFASDIDGNETKEIAVWDSEAGQIVCYDYTLQPLWTLEVGFPVITAAAEDLDGDGPQEIFLLLDLPDGEFFPYRVISVQPDGTTSWGKYIEINVEYDDLQFQFINADGKEGKEVIIANRILVQRGLERMAFGWDRIIVSAGLFGDEDSPYFLLYLPEESSYELYTFDEELVLWEGKPCEVEEAEQSLQEILCSLFMKTGRCSCSKDWAWNTSDPVTKSVRLWADFTGDGKREALYITDTEVQLTDGETTVWEWKIPLSVPIEDVAVLDMTGDTCSEILITTDSTGTHVPSLFVLDCTGTLQSVYALNLSGTPFALFTDVDGDTDTDVVTFAQKSRGSSLQIYTNTLHKGLLDELEPGTPLEVVDPSSFTTAIWIAYAKYRILFFVLLGAAVLGCIYVMRRKPKERKESQKD